jgi:hypothetical protein
VNREEFEHVIRAAADIVKDDIVVIGSQAVLAQHPDAPALLLRSSEVDVFPRSDPTRSDEIDGAIGDGSRFHETYGYYAHGVGPEAVIAPTGWQDRLIPVEVPARGARKATVTARCLEIHDLVIAKLAANRPHDHEFVEETIRAGLVDVSQLRAGVELLSTRDRARVRERLIGAIAKVGR